ncbi:hypothetical protein D6D28_09910 [Aureobasidium pullulans]|uniref:Transmembrane protein n=1 Tax=Aureobasidium pullulans TaxID=5580 RepID=A0A4S8S304_AURPU|nr:hypothetical protein D6D28_09910 [Aureobasidium pullulans]
MSRSKSPQPDDTPESIWTLIKQLRFRDLINAIKQTVIAIKQTVIDDFQHLANVARGRKLSFETIALLVTEFVKTRTGRAIIIALVVVAFVVAVVILVYPMCVAAPFLGALGFTHAGPAAGSIAAAVQTPFGVGALFSTLQSAAMAGYGVAVVSGVVQSAAAAGVAFAGVFAAYKTWSGRKHKTS